MKKYIIYAFMAFMAASCCTNAEPGKQCDTKCEGKKKDIALQLYSVRDDISKDYEGTIKKVGEMGFTAVEAANYDNGKFYGKTPEEFKADIEKNGMKVLSSHTAKQLSEAELKSKDLSESLKWWDECIAAHKAAGMKYIVTPSMPVPATLKDLQTYCEYYNEIGKKCNENGIKYGYHNHDFEFQKIEDKMMLDYMIENTDADKVFFEMDVYWAVIGKQSPVDYFNKYQGRFALLHIKDNKEVGQSGMVGFDAIFKNADTAGLKHIVVEVENCSDFTPLEGVKRSLEYLQNSCFVKESYAACCEAK